MQITPFDLPNALAAHYQLQRQQDNTNAQNAFAQALPQIQSDPQNALAIVGKTGNPDAYARMSSLVANMDTRQRAQAADRSEALGSLLMTLKSEYKDPVVRKAVALSRAADLAPHGVTPDQLQSADYTDGGIDLGISNVTSVKEKIAQANNERDAAEKAAMDANTIDYQGKTLAGQADTRAETARHDKAAEASAAQAANGGKSWQILTDPKTNTQFRYNPVTGASTALDGVTPYSPSGAAKIASGQPRSAAALAATRYVQEHPDATAADVSQFAADYGKTVKSVANFATGKQGDMVRSFNVAISHLNTLGGLVDALGNGDVQALNRISNAYQQQTGSAAPTSFDAAKAIVGDEIIKAIVGGGGALADRENAQNQISRAESPAQLQGVINTYKELMAGQLKGLKKQYTDTTGRSDFDQRLAPETSAELEPKKGTASGWSNFKVHN